MPERSPRKRRLILIGECPQQRDALRQALAVSSYLHVLHEINTREAFAYLTTPKPSESAARPELILVDLPQASAGSLEASVELVQGIKTHAALQGVPVVLLGDGETLQSLSQSRESQCCSLVRKPSEGGAFRRMAGCLGEYWGMVARVPVEWEEPLDREEEARPAAAAPCFDNGPEAKNPHRPVEILVVDDNNDDAVLFQESLGNFEQIKLTQILDDPETAWDYLRKQGRFENAATPDLVVLDIHMPRKSGLAFLDDIKADPALWMLPVVMLTASRYEEDICEAYRRGASTFVEKPPRIEWFRELAMGFANYWCHAAYLPRRDKD